MSKIDIDKIADELSEEIITDCKVNSKAYNAEFIKEGVRKRVEMLSGKNREELIKEAVKLVYGMGKIREI